VASWEWTEAYATLRSELNGMKRVAFFLASAALLFAQGERDSSASVTAVRHWSMAEVTRIAVEVTGPFTFRTDRLRNPDRVYYDIPGARPLIDGKRIYSEPVQDQLVSRIRVAETAPGVTRVVLEIAAGVEVGASQLSNPSRLIVEIRRRSSKLAQEGLGGATEKPATVEPPPAAQPAPAQSVKPRPVPFVPRESRASAAPQAPLPKPPDAKLPPASTELPASLNMPAVSALAHAGASPPKSQPAKPEPKTTDNTAKADPAPEPAERTTSPADAKTAAAKPEAAPKDSAAPRTLSAAAETGKAASRTSSGDRSLVRALGLKLERVVIDPGHGGHDQGTEGPHGLLEKDVVLDVAKRLGKLIETRMGAEVIYTRSDDTFIPLEGRTALANEKRADLFLSIHANSAPTPKVAGVETFYLNITGSKDALDVAARENAASEKSIFELTDLIQKITKHDKAEESREFAGRIQSSLWAFSARNVANSKNRGVKTAPLVVLIGASMPSVLAEIGFLSNPKEEALLKKSDYRQKLADALFRGVSRYADSLSHFQSAKPAAKTVAAVDHP
jgi:N-acetylmuramoyl-L-alanine amidase